TQLGSLLSINLSNQSIASQIASLQIELQSNQLDIDQLVEQQSYFDGDWNAFTSIVTSYLKFAKDVEPNSILKSHDLLLNYYNDLSIGFLNNSFGNHLSVLIYETTKILVPMMKKIDKYLNLLNNGKKFKRLIFISTILTKIFNHLRSLKGDSNKKNLIIFIVNNLNKIYFIINSPLLCANIFANMNLLNLNFNKYPKSQQIEYRYILGRYYMIKNQLYKAYHHLNWSYMNSHKVYNPQNTIRILRYLIPISILIGKIPSLQILNISIEFQQNYIPLIKYLKQGNHLQFQKTLYDNQLYFKSKFILILLIQRSKVLIFRNLFYKIMTITQSTRFSYDELATSLLKSIGTQQQQSQTLGNDSIMYQILNEPIDDLFVENVCVSLIENDLIRGNVLSRARTLVLSKKEPFTDIPMVFKRKFGVNSSENWM
ncbi:hypothetical protein WICANDRAFT_14311, partial [Wickerhamomyces anomalus NRRL Y-366-8]